MRSPSVKRLMNELKLNSKQASLIKALAKACDDRNSLEELIQKYCPSTDAYARRCHNDPFDRGIWRVTMALHAMNDICGTHGVEALGQGRAGDCAPPFEYLNTGDTYATTLIYKRGSHSLVLGSWGDIAEKMSTDEV